MAKADVIAACIIVGVGLVLLAAAFPLILGVVRSVSLLIAKLLLVSHGVGRRAGTALASAVGHVALFPIVACALCSAGAAAGAAEGCGATTCQPLARPIRRGRPPRVVAEALTRHGRASRCAAWCDACTTPARYTAWGYSQGGTFDFGCCWEYPRALLRGLFFLLLIISYTWAVALAQLTAIVAIAAACTTLVASIPVGACMCALSACSWRGGGTPLYDDAPRVAVRAGRAVGRIAVRVVSCGALTPPPRRPLAHPAPPLDGLDVLTLSPLADGAPPFERLLRGRSCAGDPDALAAVASWRRLRPPSGEAMAVAEDGDGAPPPPYPHRVVRTLLPGSVRSLGPAFVYAPPPRVSVSATAPAYVTGVAKEVPVDLGEGGGKEAVVPAVDDVDEACGKGAAVADEDAGDPLPLPPPAAPPLPTEAPPSVSAGAAPVQVAPPPPPSPRDAQEPPPPPLYWRCPGLFGSSGEILLALPTGCSTWGADERGGLPCCDV